jgi:hypothetical protein
LWERKITRKYMDTAFSRRLLGLIVLLLFGVSFPQFMFLYALTDYANDLPSSYGSGCQVCHVSASGGGTLNSFGTDYSDHENDIDAITKFDSDGDGHNNEKELKAGTFPGDPDSSPPQGIPGFPYESILLGIVTMVLLLWGLRRRS